MTDLNFMGEAFDVLRVAPPPPAPAPKTRTLSSYKVRPVSWLMPGRVPMANVTILAGSPGEGKSTLTMALAGAVTAGGDAVTFVGSEDDPASTIRPRLAAAGGRDDLFHIFPAEGDAVFPDDSEYLEAAVRANGSGLVIIDPIAAHLSPMLNANSDHSIRQGMRPLARMAQRTGAAVIVVMHLRKSREGSPLAWLGGSGGFGGIARSVLMFGALKDDAATLDRAHHRYIFHPKCNLAPLAPALQCWLEDAEVDIDGQLVETSRLVFGASDGDARIEDIR